MNDMNRIPQTHVAADTAGDLMNSLRGGEQTAAPVATSAAPVPPAAPSDDGLKVIPKTNVAADTVGDLMNNLHNGSNQSNIPTFNPGPADQFPDPKVIPKTNVAVEPEESRQKAALKRLRDAMRSDKPMVINPDGSLSVLDNKKKAEADVKTIPKTNVASNGMEVI